MKMTFCPIALVLALSLCGCSASEKTEMNNLGKDSTNALKTVGKDVGNIGQAMKSSTKDVEKDNSKHSKDSKQNNDLQKNASNAVSALGKEADKTEHAMAGAIKGLGKNIDAAHKNEKGMNRRSDQNTKLEKNAH